ncbi:hypothetical protein BUE80_DR011952 [Diplocarpon rosae]|nr:hypothetical protein BUE80_DR011952 [Diplocarpon rosae]
MKIIAAKDKIKKETHDTPSGSPSSVLVLARKASKPSMSERMGSDVLTLIIGEESSKHHFTLHKNLLAECGGMFLEICNETTSGQTVAFEAERDAFKLFVDYLYSDNVPAVPFDGTAAVKAHKLLSLIKLYVFADISGLEPKIRDKIMDNIQDGFYMVREFPNGDLIYNVYKNSGENSKLRKFCAASLVYNIHDPNHVQDKSIAGLLTGNEALMADFLEAVRAYIPHQDPRVRHCRFKENCAECDRAGSEYLNEADGVAPCSFHVHAEIKGEAGDPVCHLWL